MKRYILLGLITLITCHTFGQGSYKVKSSGSKGEFIVPPDTYWGFKENGKKKCGYDRYYYILIDGLSDDYISSISNIQSAKSWSGNKDYFPDFNLPKDNMRKKVESGKTKVFEGNSDSKILFKAASLNEINSTCLFQIDFNALISDDGSVTISNFKRLAKELLIRISSKEGSGEEKFNWPTSISQNIVEKVFELIPIPQEASLARYGLIQNSSFSLLPLNPKIHLRVDHATLYDSRTSDNVTNTQLYLDYLKALIDTNDTNPEKNSEIVQVPLEREKLQSALQSTSFRFQFTGQSIISYSKFQDNNGNVFFKFAPFLGNTFNRIGATNNFPNSSTRYLASSIDVDFTTEVNKSKYLILLQKYLRGNNNISLPEDDDYYQCCRRNPNRCNSLILFRNALTVLNSDFDDCDSITDFAIFGERNPIVPMILIEINSNKLFIPLGYTVFDLISNGYIKSEFRFKREYSGTTKTFKNTNLKTILLPSDVIKSK